MLAQSLYYALKIMTIHGNGISNSADVTSF